MINEKHKKFYEALMNFVAPNNGGTKCDMMEGPCSCGAWHSLEDFTKSTRWGSHVIKWIKKELRAKPKKRLYLLLKYGLTRQDAYVIQQDLGIVRKRKSS